MPTQDTDFPRLSREALLAFRKGQYHEALQLLQQLSGIRGGRDPRVEHNLAVLQYYTGREITIGHNDEERNTHSLPAALLKAFDTVLAMPALPDPSHVARPAPADNSHSDPLLCSTPEPEETFGSPGSGTGNDSDADSPSYAPSSSAAADRAPAIYNRAVTLFHLAHYDSAAQTLEPLIQNVETIDAYFGFRACLLAAECRLAASKPEEALAVTSLAERVFIAGGENGDDYGRAGRDPAARRLDSNADSPSLFASLAASSANAHLHPHDQGEAGEDTSRFTPSPDRFDDRWGRDSDAGSDGVTQSPSRTLGTVGRRLFSGPPTGPSGTVAEDYSPALGIQDAVSGVKGGVPAALAIFKARAYLLLGNTEDAAAQIAAAQHLGRADNKTGTMGVHDEDQEVEDEAEDDDDDDDDNVDTNSRFVKQKSNRLGHRDPTTAFLSAQLHSHTGELKKAISVLQSADLPADGTKSVNDREWDHKYYMNDLGCLNHLAGKHAAAAMCFAEALRVNTKHMEMVEASGQEEEIEEWERHLEEEESEGQGTTGKDNDTQPPVPALLRRALDISAPALYNAGLQLLLLQKAEDAFRCFERAIEWVHARGGDSRSGGANASNLRAAGPPKVPLALAWLRMAECCVQKLEADQASRKRSMAPRSIAVGGYKIIVAQPQRQGRTFAGSLSDPAAEPSSPWTYDYAMRCYQNALACLGNGGDVGVRTAASVGMAYAALRGEMPLVALAASMQVIKSDGDKHGAKEAQAGIQGPVVEHVESGTDANEKRRQTELNNLRLLAHIYASRSLSLLSRPSESLSLLHTAASQIPPPPSPSSPSQQYWTAAKLAQASAVCAAAERNHTHPVGLEGAEEAVAHCDRGETGLMREARDVERGLRTWIALAKGNRNLAADTLFGVAK
ncbi:hypothetical protein HK104_001335 [Borealophlyctis nickersoniae]|nr:hypothetical protein HK104_001335 [Borealophlyctis nickersoniae]